MVSDEEAADIIISRLKADGFEIKDGAKERIAIDIKTIRERKIKGTKDVTDKWRK